MSAITFDYDKFGDIMMGWPKLHFSDTKKHAWNERDDLAMHYSYDGFNYRTWKHSVSVCRHNAAILVSCKIDQRRTPPRKDDHVILLASVNRFQGAIAAQAAVQSIHHNMQSHSPIIVNDKKNDMGDQFEAALADTIKTMLGKTSDKGVADMAAVATLNLRALALSVFVR